MSNIHIQPLISDASGHNTVELVRLDLRMKQTVAERWKIKHARLGAGCSSMTLYFDQVTPKSEGEQVSGEVVAGDALQYGGSLGFWGGLGLLELLLGGLHSCLECLQLGLADALDAYAQCRLLACDELVLGFIPVRLPIAGEAALAHGFGACAHAGACGYDGAVYRDLGLEVDAAR